MDERLKEAFKREVKKYLNFSERYEGLAEEIANETVEKERELFGRKVGRISKLTFQQRVELATNACIRHNYTGYDDILIEKTIEQSYPMIEDRDIDIREDAVNEVAEFIKIHRK